MLTAKAFAAKGRAVTQTAPNADRLRIDIVSDVVCPWCIIGFLQLRAACNATGTLADVVWHPFELNPAMPAEGQDLAEHLAEKYGTTPEQSTQTRDMLTGLGEDLGFTFTFSPGMRMHNSFLAHQLIRLAAPAGLSHAAKLTLFKAHFSENRDIGSIEVLADLASTIGLDRDETRAALETGAVAAEVRDEERFWTSQGITGVPAMIFDRKFLITGAQGVENFTGIVQRIAAA